VAGTAHFDRRAARYDRDGAHHRVASLVVASAELVDGCRVLDVATGTGFAALEAAGRIGPSGEVIGVDLSEAMLGEARRKAQEARAANVRFAQGDAERLSFSPASFDRILCSSALALMTDAPRALRHWRDLLKPGGLLAFDAPSTPFGFSERAAAAAARHGIRLGFSDLADTPDKCRALLEGAALDVVSVRKAIAASGPLALDRAVAMFDERIDHPAWRALGEAPPALRAAIRADYIRDLAAAAVDGRVANEIALCFAVGRRPAP